MANHVQWKSVPWHSLMQSTLTSRCHKMAPLCSVVTTAQLIQQRLNSDSVQVQTLFEVCRRFAIVRISDNGRGWKQDVNSFRRSTIPQKQFNISH